MRAKDEIEMMYGKEPDPSVEINDEKKFFSDALNYYNFTSDSEKKKQWFLEYLKSVNISTEPFEKISSGHFTTAGAVARLYMRGLQNDYVKEYLETSISKLKTVKKKLVNDSVDLDKETEKNNKRDAKIRYETNQAIVAYEGMLDDFIKTGCHKNNIQCIPVTKETQEQIAKKYSVLLNELTLSLTDDFYSEAYSNFTTKQKHNLINELDKIIKGSTIVKSVVRKPRKKKEKSPEKQVKKLKYMDKFDELKVKSIDPERIVGASSLWLYNTKYRTLTNLICDNEKGFTVKGTTVIGISEESKAKKIRKPESIIPNIISMGKVPLRKVFENLTTKYSKVNDRINNLTILLRAD